MNYIEKFMQDNNLAEEQLFKIKGQHWQFYFKNFDLYFIADGVSYSSCHLFGLLKGILKIERD